MALTAQDMYIMETFTNHPVIADLTAGADWGSISDWYATNPKATLDTTIMLLSIIDRAKFFECVDFHKWYSDFNYKLQAGGGKSVLGYTLEQIKGISTLLLVDLVNYNLTEHSMPMLVTDMFKRETTQTLNHFMICLGCDEILEEETLSRIGIELSGYPRWVSIGLSESPTYSDCLDVYSS